MIQYPNRCATCQSVAHLKRSNIRTLTFFFRARISYETWEQELKAPVISPGLLLFMSAQSQWVVAGSNNRKKRKADRAQTTPVSQLKDH